MRGEHERPTVRVMTWNIHGAVGHNPRFDLAQVVALIREHDPDIVALQEVDSRRPAELPEDPFVILQSELSHYGIGAKSISTADGDYGQMLLSRWPLDNCEVHDISIPEREPRRAICAEIETPGGEMRVIATHLGLSLRERHAQVRKLRVLTRDETTPTVVMGDFNDWLFAGSVRKALSRMLPGRTQHRTFPSRWPLFRFDRVYCRPRPALVHSFVDYRAVDLSDHLPVIADVAMPPG